MSSFVMDFEDPLSGPWPPPATATSSAAPPPPPAATMARTEWEEVEAGSEEDDADEEHDEGLPALPGATMGGEEGAWSPSPAPAKGMAMAPPLNDDDDGHQREHEQEHEHEHENEHEHEPRPAPPTSTTEDEDDVTLLHIPGVAFVPNAEKTYSSSLLQGNSPTLVGTLAATAYALVFQCDTPADGPLGFLSKDFFRVPMGCIAKLKGPKSEESSSRMLTILCRDVRALNFRFETTSEALKVENLLRTFAFPVNPQTNAGLNCLYAFAKRKTLFGVDLFFPPRRFPTRFFRESHVNRDFALVPTYPDSFFVPANVSDDMLRQVSAFRSKGRLPALCWFDESGGGGGRGGSIWRCSQPKVGVTSAFSLEDEAMVDAIRLTTASQQASIFDCRPHSSAMANRMRGMGYEDVSRYKNTKITFETIANVHAMRSSYASLCKVMRRSLDDSQWENWLVDMENTAWLNHVRSILSAAVRLAHMVSREGLACVVHCSDGWDRTAQVTSLAQILLDGRCRTVAGFCALVHYEWIMFGHRFRDRLGVGVPEEVNSDERAPVFIQFLDCVWQLLRQFPRHFAFGEDFLAMLAEHAFSCRFGEFVHNSYQEYLSNSSSFVSLWTHLSGSGSPKPLQHCSLFANPSFDASTSSQPILPRPSSVCRNVAVWTWFYGGAQFAG